MLVVLYLRSTRTGQFVTFDRGDDAWAYWTGAKLEVNESVRIFVWEAQ